MKKLLFFIMVVTALCFALTVCASAAQATVNGAVYNLDDGGTATVANLDASATVVTIPSVIVVDGAKYNVTGFDVSSGKSTITNKTTVKELYITSEYITEIPANAFNGASKLEIAKCTSPIVTYGNSCFMGLSVIKTVYMNFSSCTKIEAAAFRFLSNGDTQSKDVNWEYNGEPINLYNCEVLGESCFRSSSIGEGNTIIYPKYIKEMGNYAFTGAKLHGTVYINAKTIPTKILSGLNYPETFILGPDCETTWNFNNGADKGFNGNVKNVIILASNLYSTNNKANLFESWGTYDLYYYNSDATKASMDKQTNIGTPTRYIIDSYTFSYDDPCVLSLSLTGTVKGGSEQKSVAVNDVHHISDLIINTVGARDVISTIKEETVSLCCARVIESKVIAPLFSFLGYSAQIGGNMVCVGYRVNLEALDYFSDVSAYGVVVAIPDDYVEGSVSDRLEMYEPVNNDLSMGVDRGVIAEAGKESTLIELKIVSFEEEYHHVPVIIGLFVVDGEDVDYVTYMPPSTDPDEKVESGLVVSEYASVVTFSQIAADCAKNA